MSVEFIKERHNARYLSQAVKQQKDLSYYITSNLQEDISLTYIQQWAQRKYVGNDKFLNWVKTVFRTENFLSFFKYLRYPLVSAKLINDEIKPQLQRVFHAEDSYFKYTIAGKQIECPSELDRENFERQFFNSILFNHNDVVVHDLDNINEPFREIIEIDSIVSIESEYGKISKIAYKSGTEINGIEVEGFSYIDESSYIFYDSKFNELLNIPHDQKECPADWISSENFFTDNDIVKKSIFSYVKNDLEELVFLKTLQRMTEPNGAIPVVTKLKTTEAKKDGNTTNGLQKEPMAANSLGSQQSEQNPLAVGSNNQLQTGTTVSVPFNKKQDGSIDMDVVKNYFNFHYIPVECLKYLNDRLQAIQADIVISTLGDYTEQNLKAINELQVSKSYANKEDKLRWLSNELSRITKLSDRKVLALKYGIEKVQVDIFYGSDFFLETQADLYNNFSLAPNSIERRSILIRLSQNRNKFNRNKAERESILYKLIPYASDKDFDTANSKGNIDSVTFDFHTRFDYWITLFEAEYGDIQVFWNQFDTKESEKLVLINNLIKQIIKDETTANRTP